MTIHTRGLSSWLLLGGLVLAAGQAEAAGRGPYSGAGSSVEVNMDALDELGPPPSLPGMIGQPAYGQTPYAPFQSGQQVYSPAPNYAPGTSQRGAVGLDFRNGQTAPAPATMPRSRLLVPTPGSYGGATGNYAAPTPLYPTTQGEATPRRTYRAPPRQTSDSDTPVLSAPKAQRSRVAKASSKPAPAPLAPEIAREIANEAAAQPPVVEKPAPPKRAPRVQQTAATEKPAPTKPPPRTERPTAAEMPAPPPEPQVAAAPPEATPAATPAPEPQPAAPKTAKNKTLKSKLISPLTEAAREGVIPESMVPASAAERSQQPQPVAEPAAQPAPRRSQMVSAVPPIITDEPTATQQVQPSASPDMPARKDKKAKAGQHPPAVEQTASLPPPAAVADQGEGRLRILFDGDTAAVPESVREPLRQLAAQIGTDESMRLQLQAYAGGSDENASSARRLSLSRALAVRTYLIEQGVRSTRIDVRALGNKSSDGPADRVDVAILGK